MNVGVEILLYSHSLGMQIHQPLPPICCVIAGFII